MTTIIIEIIIVLLFSGFFSGMEIAFVSSSKLRFEMDRAESVWGSRLVSVFYAHPNSFISSILVGNNISLVIYGILMAKLLDVVLLTPIGNSSRRPSSRFRQTAPSRSLPRSHTCFIFCSIQ